VQRLFASHNVGRQMTLQRRQLRGPNLPRQNQFDRTSVPNLQQQNPPGRPGAPQQPNPNLQQKGNPAAPKRGGGPGERLKKLNPFAPKRNELPR
jgi:hypothetical protein